MIWRILLYGILFYFIYQLLVGLIIPVFKTTRRMRKDFNDIKNRMNEFINDPQQNKNSQYNSKETSATKSKSEDYIDFEEVK